MHILYVRFNDNMLDLWIEMYLIDLALHVRGVSTYLQHVIFLEPQGSVNAKLSCSYLSLMDIPTLPLFHLSLELIKTALPISIP